MYVAGCIIAVFSTTEESFEAHQESLSEVRVDLQTGYRYIMEGPGKQRTDPGVPCLKGFFVMLLRSLELATGIGCAYSGQEDSFIKVQ